MLSILECNRIINSIYPYSLNFTTLFTSHLSSILALFFSKSLMELLLHDERSSILNQVLLFISFFIAINVHMARNPLQIDLHLVILLLQVFYSHSYLISIVLTNSDFSIFQSFQSSLIIRKNPDFSYPYVRFFIDKIYYFFNSEQFCIKTFTF